MWPNRYTKKDVLTTEWLINNLIKQGSIHTNVFIKRSKTVTQDC
jgi:hypothetical protein